MSMREGEVHVMSGQVTMASGAVISVPTAVVIPTSGDPLVVGAISGGINLLSGAVVGVVVKAPSTNSGVIYVGGVSNQPYSGCGFILAQGDALDIAINNMGHVKCFAVISGDWVTYVGVR